ncbi:LysR substrate-binding domain-containing protein [Burkholderia plantarii]|uniref:LysR substrate-binding domain-containing protein n=1 Tax=Burkholderia plantarii TaxID=41899 RepID=UPI00070583B1|nr:LysR substrate-binding domain-containing protein [Burkholderia plantarii]ALK30690.1 LysR family transcriptional regulator [Burkholderia plantarii]GLZ19304.1 HTH-type transcriptional regulator TrpI [Burkholderia plantarii]
MRRLPPLNALRVFDVAARRSSFSAAADELCVTHGAVSHQIRVLEDWFGKRLFVRHAAGVRLTAAGESLHDAAGHALGTLESRCAEIAGRAAFAEIVLGAPGSFLANWLIPRFERFEAAYPAIRVRLQTSAALADLQSQAVDALIVSGRDWPRQFEVTALLEERIGPVCAPDWPHRLDAPRRLVGQALLHTRSHPQAWREWAAAQGLDATGFDGGRQFDHLSLMLEAAAARLGVAVAPALLVEREIVGGRLVAPLGFVACGGAFAFCTLRGRQAEGLATLRDWLKQEAQDAQDAQARRPVAAKPRRPRAPRARAPQR